MESRSKRETERRRPDQTERRERERERERTGFNWIDGKRYPGYSVGAGIFYEAKS